MAVGPQVSAQPLAGSEEAGLRLLPMEIVSEARAPAADSCIGGYDPEALARLIRGLTV